ncbi:serine/threonine protein kinase [Phytophthora nicotianae]|uniref:Serine/threonine protein kinase n=2 Tax=Phytophthora nicotianae TaxID=4792 RepID=W2KVU9_PHYNI|nr:serine/threonine protein kinase [Phytophthora nicotianae]ETL89293.1 serine/threonine protein kinase [Phytophthora nicotianae]ETO71274.1 serine/threonine protein kinase [Phytophthora nicotianae P1976]
MSHDSVRLLRAAPPAKSALDLSAHDMAMVRLGSGSTFQRSHSKPEHPTSQMGVTAVNAENQHTKRHNGKKLLFLRKFSVLEEDIVICNRVRCGVDPSYFQHRNAGDHRYLRALSFEEARLAATRRRRSVSMAAAYPKKSQSMRINASDLTGDDDVPTSSSSASTEHSSFNSITGHATIEDAVFVPPLKSEGSMRVMRAGSSRKNMVNSRMRTASESSALLTPREKAMHGRYLIRESFAAGAYGKVCSGQDKSSLEEVAVKIVPKYILISPEEKQSVVREQVIHKGLDHPHIVKLLDIYEDDGAHYFILERADCGSLNTMITAAGIEESKCRDFFRQLLLALEYLHDNNIVHHDIKPHNVLLDDDGATVKICDFGASRAFDAHDASLPFAGIFGTVGYIAPELLEGKESYGPAIDMFSAGIMLFEMVFGYGPFYPPSACTHQDLEFPNRPKASPEVKQLLTRLLETDPSKRITAGQALGHPWITLGAGGRSAPSSLVNVSSGLPPSPTCVRR